MSQSKLIAYKEWAYYIYDKDNTIELTVPIPAPTPGFDIVYILSEPEKEAYVKTGIKALESRIADMSSNYTAFIMHPWRWYSGTEKQNFTERNLSGFENKKGKAEKYVGAPGYYDSR